MGFELLDESFSAAGVGVTTVHEAVDIYFLESVFRGYVAESEEMGERRVDATVAGQAHEVDGLVMVAGIGESVDYLGIRED